MFLSGLYLQGQKCFVTNKILFMYLKVSLTLTRQGFGVKNILIQSSKNQYDLRQKILEWSWWIGLNLNTIPKSNKLKKEIFFISTLWWSWNSQIQTLIWLIQLVPKNFEFDRNVNAMDDNVCITWLCIKAH